MVRTPIVSPIAQLFGVQVVEFDAYSVPPKYVVAVKPGDVHRNEHGTVSGGYLSLVMDDTMGALLCALVPSGVAVTSTITFQFLEAVKPGTMLLVIACVTKSGLRIGFVDCEIRSGDRVMARGSGVWLQKKAHI